MKLKRVICILMIIAVMAAGVTAAIFYYNTQQQKEQQQTIESIAQSANDIVESVNQIFSVTVPVTYVYDRDSNLLTTLRVSNALQPVTTLPAVLTSAIAETCDNNPAMVIASEFLMDKSAQVTQDMITGYSYRLNSEFTQDMLYCYLATTSIFGEHVGLVAAAEGYFSTDVDKLSNSQISVLAKAYRDSTFVLQDYLDDNSLTLSSLGVDQNAGYLSVLKDLLIEELATIPDIDPTTVGYKIKIAISLQQQSVIQSLVDSELKSFLDFNSDGSYNLDCSALVIDRSLGLIRAYIPGRSTSSVSAKAFSLNGVNFISNYYALVGEVSKTNTFGFSLREITLSNGDKDVKTLDELFTSLTLSSGSTSSFSVLDLIDMLFSSNLDYTGTHFIYEVKDTTDNTLYVNEGDTAFGFTNIGVCEYFNDSGETRTSYGMDFELATGVVSFEVTSDYVLVAIAGTGAMGGNIASGQKTSVKNLVSLLKGSVASFYPTPSNALWIYSNLNDAHGVAYSADYELLRERYNQYCSELNTAIIVSQEGRRNWETLYEEANDFIDSFEESLGADYCDAMRLQLQDIRLTKQDSLLLYAA